MIPSILNRPGRAAICRLLFNEADIIAEILQGDSREVLKTFSDNHFHAILTDPPYELTNGKTTDKKKSGGFMGKAWDGSGVAFDVSLWAECLRVLRPGGYLLSFGGSRTYHRMACAIEDAGFILHPMIGFVQGQGFPKATNLSKMLDKDAGQEREVIGPSQYANRGAISAEGSNDGWKRPSHLEHTIRVDTAPATPEAKAWDGWYYGKQSLKPALEPICMAQKPPEGRMVDNIRAWGCGGVNIDGCRIGTSDNTGRPCGTHGWQQYTKGFTKSGELVTESHAAGRFPANLILGHAPGCKRIGRKQVKSTPNSKTNRTSATMPTDRGWNGNTMSNAVKYAPNGYADASGHEEIDDWLCQEGCPIRLMGEQSGIRAKGAFPKHRSDTPNNRMSGRNYAKSLPERVEADSGTAARFFLNIDPDPFQYCAKASSSERMGSKFPTIKPLKLIKYLVTLITPPGGIVLDPFLGSGTTGLACNELGFDWVGIDLDTSFALERLAAYQAPSEAIQHKPLTAF